jgi:polar amino acid transport system substrate-binding protein
MTRRFRRACSLAALIAIAACDLSVSSSVGGAAASEPTPPEPQKDPAAAQQGHSIFNQTCAHCHGSNAVTGQQERNLRHLRLRYGDDMWKVFHATVTQGRPDKGMPVWGEILNEHTIEQIYAYLESVQSDE